MSFLARPFERRSSLENPSAWLVNWFSGGPPTASGVRVDPESALRAAAVFACVRILAETLGSLSLHVYRRLPDGGKERFPAHPLYQLLHNAPNEEMTSVEWRECQMGAKALRGNGYSRIEFRGDGRPGAIWPLHPDRTRVLRDLRTKQLRYEYSDENGRMIPYRQGEIIHERSFGGNGIIGYSPIRQAAEAVGISLAAEEHGARFFSNGASMGGIIEHPGELKDEAFEKLRSSFAANAGGVINAHKPFILEEGMKWHDVPLNHEQAQFLETRKFQVTEIARIFRVPPHMIADLEKATFSNIEHQAIEFVTHTMLPWVVRAEQRFNQTLFLPSEQTELFCEFSLETLLRGDIKSRFEAYQIMRRNGALSANEWRAKENQNPIPGGDTYIIEANMIPLDMLGQNIARPTTEQKRLAEAFLPCVLAGAQRALRKEIKALRALAKRADAPAAIVQFYAEHRTYLTEQIGPAFESIGLALDTDLAARARTVAEEHCAEAQRLAEASAGDATAMDNLLNAWEESRATALANKALAALRQSTTPKLPTAA